MSAPAFAWETAVSARTSRVASLSTSPLLEHPAVAVAHVLAEADIGDDENVGHLLLDPPDRPLDDAVVGHRPGGDLILLLGDPEEEDRRDPQRLHPLRLLDDVVDGHLKDPRHGDDRLLHLRPRHGEQGIDQVVDARASSPGSSSGNSRSFSASSAGIRGNS